MAQALESLVVLMKDKGWTQARLAEALGVRQPTVSMWLTGRAVMPAGRVGEVKALLGWVPEEGRGSELVEGALSNLENFVLNTRPTTPLLYLLLVGMPQAVGDEARLRSGNQGQASYYQKKVARWAAYLGLSVEGLLEAAVKKRPIGWEQVELVAKAGWKFAALGEHVARELSAAERKVEVLDFLDVNGPFEDMEHLQDAAEYWCTKKVHAYLDGYEAAAAWDVRYREVYPGLFDMDELWRGYQEGNQ
jgi:hypothetical protein